MGNARDLKSLAFGLVGSNPTGSIMKTIRTCNECGAEYYTSNYASKTVPCPDCDGTMCLVIKPRPNQRLSGVLYREKYGDPNSWTIHFILHKNQYTTVLRCKWTKEQWQKQYGKLPRKGSSQIIILELSNV